MTQFNAQQAFGQLAAPQFRDPSFLEKLQTLLPQFLAKVADSNFEQGGSPLRISELIEKLGPPSAQQRFQNDAVTTSIDQQLIQSQLQALVSQGRESRAQLAAPGQRAATERSQRGILGRDPKPGQAFKDVVGSLLDEPSTRNFLVGKSTIEKEKIASSLDEINRTFQTEGSRAFALAEFTVSQSHLIEGKISKDDKVFNEEGTIKDIKLFIEEVRKELPNLSAISIEDLIAVIRTKIITATSASEGEILNIINEVPPIEDTSMSMLGIEALDPIRDQLAGFIGSALEFPGLNDSSVSPQIANDILGLQPLDLPSLGTRAQTAQDNMLGKNRFLFPTPVTRTEAARRP